MGVNQPLKLFYSIPIACRNDPLTYNLTIFRLLPRDSEAQYFIGKPQLMEFLCWLDYANRLAKECCVPEIVRRLAENIRIDLFELSIEPMISILDINIVGFMLVLMAKIIRQIDAPEFCDGKGVNLIFCRDVFRLCE